jgi:hypothetical protein
VRAHSLEGRGLAAPKVFFFVGFLTILRQAWERFKVIARIIGNFQSRVLLTLFYFVILAPFGLGVRLFGDPLGLKRQHRSHWLRRDIPPSAGPDSAKRQF